MRRPAIVTQAEVERAPPRLAYRVDELVDILGVSRTTIYERIKDGSLKSSTRLSVRLVSAESVRAAIGESEA